MLSKGFAFIKFPLTTQSLWTATPLYISTSQRSKSNIDELNLFNYATKHTTCRQETSSKQFMDSKDIRQKIASIKFEGCSCTTKCPVVSLIFYTFVENFLKHLFINCSEFSFYKSHNYGSWFLTTNFPQDCNKKKTVSNFWSWSPSPQDGFHNWGKVCSIYTKLYFHWLSITLPAVYALTHDGLSFLEAFASLSASL